MKKQILIPFKEADFIREIINKLEAELKSNDFSYDDDWSQDKRDGYNIGIRNAIYFLKKEVENSDNQDG